MLQGEFEQLTDVFVPTEMYDKVIEPMYMKEDMDKYEFCRRYRADVDGLAHKLQHAMDDLLQKQHEDVEKRIREVERTLQQAKENIQSLQKKLEAEQEWKPYIPKTLYREYDQIANDPCCKKMDEGEAVAFVAASFGFTPDKVKILHSYPQYEISRHHAIRISNRPSISREPMYCATDYNYVLFRVCGLDYECVDGEIYIVDL